MRILKQFARWALRDELQREGLKHHNLLVSVQADLENFTRAVGSFMRLRGYCVNLALDKQEKPSSFYMVSRFDYWCLAFYWDVNMFSGFNPLWFRGIPIIWEGDSWFRELDHGEYPVPPTSSFPGSGNKPKDKTLERSVLPSTGASKSSGCSRGRSRGEDEIPEAFFPWRDRKGTY